MSRPLCYRSSLLSVLLIALGPWPGSLQAQWRCEVINVLEPDHNVRWILHLPDEVNTPRQIEAQIRLRYPGKTQDQLRKDVKLSLKRGVNWFRIPINLPLEVYEYEVEIFDPFVGKSQILHSNGPFLVNPVSNVRLSDIFLSLKDHPDSAFRYPIMGPNLPPGTDTVYFFVELQAMQDLRIRTEAYFYENTNGSQGRSSTNITIYASLQESIQSFQLERGRKRLVRGKFPVADLPEGAYLLDVTVYAGDSNPIQETARFLIGSNVTQWVYANLDDAIRMMRYILPEITLEQLLDSPTEEARKIEFDKAWYDLYREDSQEEMEQYYLRIFEADRRFETEGGWQSDRGRILILYGEPARVEDFSGPRNTQRERWLYPKWSLMFVFEFGNQTYRLVE